MVLGFRVRARNDTQQALFFSAAVGSFRPTFGLWWLLGGAGRLSARRGTGNILWLVAEIFQMDCA